MRPISILFTNNKLDHRSGSELWVRDMCRALVGRGHKPIAFSLVLGATAHDLRMDTVPVVSDLANVAVAPDIIHGHHHIETLIAALHFPGVPIVHFCHGWVPWEEIPLHHPSIVRYVAVDDACVDRLTTESGIPPEQVERLLNFVDLKRFVPRAPLPVRPRRALVFSNNAERGGYVDAIGEACEERGIALELAGVRSGCPSEHPDLLLPEFDLVFAKARAALEAMAVGCAVIPSDIVGCGPIVTMREFEEMRSRNFGIRTLRQPHSVEWYRTQIAAYDAAEAARVCVRVREVADLDRAVDHLLDIYDNALSAHRNAAAADTRDTVAQRAAARHLSAVAARFKSAEQQVHHLSHDLHETEARFTSADQQAQQLSHDLHEAQARVTSAEQQAQQLSHDLHEAQARVTSADQQAQQLSRGLHEARARFTSAEQQVQQLSHDLRATHDLLEASERRSTRDSYDAKARVAAERDALQRLVGEYRSLRTLRLRDAILRLPVIGTMARHGARWRTNSR